MYGRVVINGGSVVRSMRGDVRVLVVGSAALGGAVGEILPRARRDVVPQPLAGVWRAGHEGYDAILLSLAEGEAAHATLRSLREVAPDARIVVCCAPADEPHARRALAAGADDYVLEPLRQDELFRALKIDPPFDGPIISAGAPAPTVEELHGLGEVLRHIGEGPEAVLARVAELLQKALGAAGVAISCDAHSAATGDMSAPVLQEPIQRGDTPIGAITLGRARQGAYSVNTAARLAHYARLIEVMLGQAREQQQWRDLAWTDDLSGLRNRRYFDGEIDRLIEQAARDRGRITVLLFDIDGFKTYNDVYGHGTGDALIGEVGLLLQRCSRETDVVARYGGDEFAVALWDAEKPRVVGSRHPTDASVWAERFRAAILGHHFRCLGPGAPGPVTISGGLACYPWDGATRAQLMHAADQALLAAKRAGKNRVELAGGGTSS